ncbi:MAG: hypothetical protein OXU79_19865 [Gemmatimonadota bacterium]|nr:hypothetical protein [Gemmatimonadota bacterium]
MNLIRWILAVPLGVVAAFLVHLFVTALSGLAHGFDRVADFWDSTDMAGMPIEGTYIMFTARVLSAAALLHVATRVAPNHKKKLSKVLAIIGVLGIGLMFLILSGLSILLSGPSLGIGGWYRNILEAFSVIFGCVVGYRFIDDDRDPKTPSSQ